MSESPNIRRWLLLEQEENRDDWGNPAGHIIWNDMGICCVNTDSSISSPDAEIRLLFLPIEATGSYLPAHVDNRDTRQWNVWCHYGRDLGSNGTEISARWRDYSRLDKSEKEQLAPRGSPDTLPRRFSRNMKLDWSHEIDRLKEAVRQARPERSAKKPSSKFDECLQALDNAWEMAETEAGLMKKVAQGKAVLSAVLAARFVLDSIPIVTNRAVDALRSTLGLCRQSGLLALAPEKEGFSTDVTGAYRSVCGAIFTAQAAGMRISDLLGSSENKEADIVSAESLAKAHLTNMRNRLEIFIMFAGWHARDTTNIIKSNPRTVW